MDKKKIAIGITIIATILIISFIYYLTTVSSFAYELLVRITENLNYFKFNIVAIMIIIVIMILVYRIVFFFFYKSALIKNNTKTVFLLTVFGIISFILIGLTVSNLNIISKHQNYHQYFLGNSISGVDISDDREKRYLFADYLDRRVLYISDKMENADAVTMILADLYHTHIEKENFNDFEIYSVDDLGYCKESEHFENLVETFSFVWNEDKYTFVLDETYFASDEIVFLLSDTFSNSYYLMSRQYYETISLSAEPVENFQIKDFGSEDVLPFANPFYGLEQDNREIHILLMLTLFVLGGSFLAIIKKDKIGLLDSALAFPVGIAINTVVGFVLILLAIPLNSLTYSILFFLFLLLSIVFVIHKVKYQSFVVEYKYILVVFLVFSLLAALFVVGGKAFYGADSQASTYLGKLISVLNGHFQVSNIEFINAFGFMSALLSTLGHAFDVGVLYAAYPMVYSCIIALITISAYEYSKNIIIKYSSVVALIAFFAIFLIPEFEIHNFWIMNNMTVGVFMLVLVLTLVNINGVPNKYHYFMILMMSVSIILSRTEGAIYVSLIIGSSFLLNINKSFIVKISASVFGFVIIYNIWILISTGGYNNPFWSPGKALLSLSAIGVVLVMALGLNLIQNKVKFLENKLIYFFMFGLLAVFVVAFLLTSLQVAADNIYILLIHLTEPTTFNFWLLLGIIWISVFVDIKPFKDKETQFLFFLTVAYVILTLCTFFFRMVNGEYLPMRGGFGDSGRRVLFQMMPFAVMLIARLAVRRKKAYEGEKHAKRN